MIINIYILLWFIMFILHKYFIIKKPLYEINYLSLKYKNNFKIK